MKHSLHVSVISIGKFIGIIKTKLIEFIAGPTVRCNFSNFWSDLRF